MSTITKTKNLKRPRVASYENELALEREARRCAELLFEEIHARGLIVTGSSIGEPYENCGNFFSSKRVYDLDPSKDAKWRSLILHVTGYTSRSEIIKRAVEILQSQSYWDSEETTLWFATQDGRFQKAASA